VTGDVEAAHAAAVAAARGSYARLVAWLARQWRDIAAAEDALAEAFARALECWPRDGVPPSPEGWLMTTAKRSLLRAARRQRLADDPTLRVLWPDATASDAEAPTIPDERLRLMFVCAHPSIDAAIRPALMLQVVLGVDAQVIARAHLVSAEAMTKRLVRAKSKIRASGIRFEDPEPEHLAARTRDVLEAIYGAYVLDSGDAADPTEGALAAEADFLAELAAELLPEQAEALGLAALIGFCEARRTARFDAAGEFVSLERQDPSRWDRARMRRADALLERARRRQAIGPFQIEAAIQAAHCERARGVPTPWRAIADLYDALLARAPTVGAQIGYAMAVARASGVAEDGLDALDALPMDVIASHQPWWATRALLLAEAGRTDDATLAHARAIALTRDPRLVRHLQRRAQHPTPRREAAEPSVRGV
jgi:RNA polymerase sigma-70 factor (ECF subfamily)